MTWTRGGIRLFIKTRSYIFRSSVRNVFSRRQQVWCFLHQRAPAIAAIVPTCSTLVCWCFGWVVCGF